MLSKYTFSYGNTKKQQNVQCTQQFYEYTATVHTATVHAQKQRIMQT